VVGSGEEVVSAAIQNWRKFLLERVPARRSRRRRLYADLPKKLRRFILFLLGGGPL